MSGTQLDYDDCQRMRELCKQLNELTAKYNIAIADRVINQLKIDDALMQHYDKISESLSIKKQIIKLCTIVPEMAGIYHQLENAKMIMKTIHNRIKNVEAEVNVIKKTYDSTPK